MKINTKEEAREKISSMAKLCLISTDNEASKQPAKDQSFYGGSFYGKGGENWPTYEDRALIPWLFLSKKDLPQSNIFQEIKALAFYIDEEFFDFDHIAEEGSQIVVRAYKNSDELMLLEKPYNFKGHPPYILNWSEVKDFPSMSHFYEAFTEEIYDYFCKNEEKENLTNQSGIKLGGWPTLVQREYGYMDLERHVLQIDMTENYMYADSGICYVSKLDNGKWYLSFDCC